METDTITHLDIHKFRYN